jgi:hypothetical protein
MIQNLINDIAFWSYVANGGIALYGFIIFAWWWRRVGRASEVYQFFTYLLLAIFIVYGGNVHIRILMAIDPQRALDFSNSVPWYVRTWLEGIVLLIIMVRMTQRIFRTLLYKRGYFEDRRGHGKEVK